MSPSAAGPGQIDSYTYIAAVSRESARVDSLQALLNHVIQFTKTLMRPATAANNRFIKFRDPLARSYEWGKPEVARAAEERPAAADHSLGEFPQVLFRLGAGHRDCWSISPASSCA